MPANAIGALFALLFGLTVASQCAAADPVADYARTYLANRHVPGAAIAVVSHGKVVEEIVNGPSGRPDGAPVGRATVFQLASITKVFSAAALFRLEQDGKVRLSDPVSKYLPGLPAPWRQVTLLQLATHTSGLPDVIANPNAPLSPAELDRTEDEALADAATRPITALPGASFRYDQTNYVLIKRVVERVSGQPFRAFVAGRILGPGMPQTSWGDSRTAIANRAPMSSALSGEMAAAPQLYRYPVYLDAAAGLNADIADMEQFAIRLTRGQIVSPSELARMWAPARKGGEVLNLAADMKLDGTFAPASGWFYADNSGGAYPRVFMTGGSSTCIMVFPRQSLAVVILTNLQDTDDPVGIAEGIARFYIPDLKGMF